MSTYTFNETATFTITHARYIAFKVATDLKKFQRFYGSPSDEWIDKYERELVVFVKYKAITSVVYGFKRNGKWTEASVQYIALPDGTLSANDDPGKIRPGLDVSGASFTSYMVWNWSGLSEADKTAIKRETPFERGTGDAPPLEAGYWEKDLSYSAGGRGLARATVRK
jgi:hypothetical protein